MLFWAKHTVCSHSWRQTTTMWISLKSNLVFLNPFLVWVTRLSERKLLGLQKHAYWQTVTCVPHCILYLQKPLREHYLHLNPKDTWLQRVQGVASIHYSAFNPVTSNVNFDSPWTTIKTCKQNKTQGSTPFVSGTLQEVSERGY